MNRTTFENPSGSFPDDLWQHEGFTPDQIAVFRQWRIGLPEAKVWRQAGVTVAQQVVQWRVAGVKPDEVASWRAAGIESAEAVQWHELGRDLQGVQEAKRQGSTPATLRGQQPGLQMRPPATHAVGWVSAGGGSALHDGLRRFQEAGVPPQVMHSYLSRQWFDEDALAWARAGIDAADAAMWRMLAVTPEEAKRLSAKGASPADTVRAWWQAGIPFDEVAAWIGAGLSPQEAAEQRTKGVTAEQAAAMRALRDQDAED